jgi:cell division protein FtsW
MARTLKSDKALFLAPLLLVGASIVMVYSASAVQPNGTTEPFYFQPWFKQLVAAVIGGGLLLVAMRVDYHQYRRPILIWALLALTVASLVAVFLFHPHKGAQRWLAMGGLSLQPSELAKLAAIFFTAALLDRRMHRVNDASYTLLPIAIVAVVLSLLIEREPDLGTAIVLVLIVGVIVFGAGLSYRYLVGGVLAMVAAGLAVIVTSPYRRERLLNFFDPWRDPLHTGYQMIQSLIAVGSGGTFGKGLMSGVQKLFYIPEPHNDFIYAVIGEELGLWGTTLILVCFVVIAWRGLRTAVVAPDRFGSLLALGLTTMVAFQALFNMSVVLKLVPATGIPLPLVSNGGSSLVINLVAMGILLNISQQSSSTAAANA